MAPVSHGTSACASSTFAPPTTNEIGAMGAMVPAYFSMTASCGYHGYPITVCDKSSRPLLTYKTSILLLTDGRKRCCELKKYLISNRKPEILSTDETVTGSCLT